VREDNRHHAHFSSLPLDVEMSFFSPVSFECKIRPYLVDSALHGLLSRFRFAFSRFFNELEGQCTYFCAPGSLFPFFGFQVSATFCAHPPQQCLFDGRRSASASDVIPLGLLSLYSSLETSFRVPDLFAWRFIRYARRIGTSKPRRLFYLWSRPFWTFSSRSPFSTISQSFFLSFLSPVLQTPTAIQNECLFEGYVLELSLLFSLTGA